MEANGFAFVPSPTKIFEPTTLTTPFTVDAELTVVKARESVLACEGIANSKYCPS